jgi:MmyB-like transcription regulator ligand binding domain
MCRYPALVAILRTASGKHPNDQRLDNLVNHLAKHSHDFRTRWAAHDVRHHYSGYKHYHHPLIGEIELMFEAMALGHDQALTLAVYPARPGSASENALRLLAQLDNAKPRREACPDHPDGAARDQPCVAASNLTRRA